MAGIGFELQRLSSRGDVSAPLSSALHGAVVVAGPWLLTVWAMALLQRLIGLQTAEAFTLQSIVIYLFCISLIATAPAVAAALRLVSDDFYLSRFEDVPAVYLCTVVLCAACGGIAGALVFGGALGFGMADLLPCALAAGIASLLWPAVAFATTVRAFRTITVGFVCGLAAGVGATVAAHRWQAGAGLEALAFASGLGLASTFITTVVLRTFPFPVRQLRKTISAIAGMAILRPSVVLGGTLAVAGIWIDSIIVWTSSAATEVPLGLATAPPYDSALFIARLTMLPGLVFHLISVDTRWSLAIRRFLGSIDAHRTLRQIENEASRLRSLTSRCLLRLILVQGIASLVFLFLAPVYVPMTGLAYVQMPTLRFGLLGAFFHVIFFVASTLVLNCGRERSFLILQVIFVVLNAGATAATLAFPEPPLGAGYFVAATLSAVAALAVLDRSLERLTHLTFEGALADSRRTPRKPIRIRPIAGAARRASAAP